MRVPIKGRQMNSQRACGDGFFRVFDRLRRRLPRGVFTDSLTNFSNSLSSMAASRFTAGMKSFQLQTSRIGLSAHFRRILGQRPPGTDRANGWRADTPFKGGTATELRVGGRRAVLFVVQQHAMMLPFWTMSWILDRCFYACKLIQF